VRDGRVQRAAEVHNIKVTISPLDVPEVPKTVEGKDLKINLKDPIELARICHSLVRVA
jgi:hypothetical protein